MFFKVAGKIDTMNRYKYLMTLKITNSFKFPKATLLFFKAAIATVSIKLFKKIVRSSYTEQTGEMTNLRTVLFQSILTLQFQFLMATRRCASTSSKYGFILVGSVFKSFPSESLHLCYITCQKNPVCQSLNYNAAENVCELSTEMSRSRPENFQQRKMFVYAEKLPDLSK